MLTKEPVSGKCRRWLYEDIREAFFMRFLLEVIAQIPTTIQINVQPSHWHAFKALVPFFHQDNAIEIFMKNGHSAFLVFLNRDHVSAYKKYDIHTEDVFKLCISQL